MQFTHTLCNAQRRLHRDGIKRTHSIHFNLAGECCSGSNAQHGPHSVMLDRIMSFPHGSRISCWYKHRHKMKRNCDECECKEVGRRGVMEIKDKACVAHTEHTRFSIASPLCQPRRRVDTRRVCWNDDPKWHIENVIRASYNYCTHIHYISMELRLIIQWETRTPHTLDDALTMATALVSTQTT